MAAGGTEAGADTAGIAGIRIITVAGDTAAAGTTGITTITVAGATAVGTIGITGTSGDFSDDLGRKGLRPLSFLRG